MPNATLLTLALFFSTPPTTPPGAGLQGLGPPGTGLRPAVGAQAIACEDEVGSEINRLRTTDKQPALSPDERLRAFAREQAEWAAKGDPRAKQAADQIRRLGLAPYGYFLQYSFGERGRVALASLVRDTNVRRELSGEYARLGVGAFWVPDDKPYCQVAVLLVRDPDPRAGQPGLTPAQTDPVMSAAATRISRQCYDPALVRDPNLRGDLLFQLTILGDGSVGEVKLLRKLGSVIMETCAVEIVAALRFPQPYKGKPVMLSHPMRFVPPQGERRIGRLSDIDIRTTFAGAAARFRACYEDALKKKPALRGSVTLKLNVAIDGAVKRPELTTNSFGDGELSRCVLRVAEELHFPRPQFDGEVELTYPLSFEPPTASQAAP
ncbi:MAG: AgmX/PglI C-terminal domain-containing protein [Myxococcota bacterium]